MRGFREEECGSHQQVADDPELTIMACLDPIKLANWRSNSATFEPIE